MTNLFAYTEYNAWVAFKNVGNYWSDFSHIDFTTKEYSEAIKILLSFPGEVTENWLTKLKDLVGNTLGVVRNRLLNGQMESFRRLQTETTGFGLVKETIFTWDLPEDRSIEGPTPATIATISDE